MNGKRYRVKDATALLNSWRGQYIISQALVKAIESMKKVKPPHREESNIADMELLLVLFPIYKHTEEAEKHYFKRRMKRGLK